MLAFHQPGNPSASGSDLATLHHCFSFPFTQHGDTPTAAHPRALTHYPALQLKALVYYFPHSLRPTPSLLNLLGLEVCLCCVTVVFCVCACLCGVGGCVVYVCGKLLICMWFTCVCECAFNYLDSVNICDCGLLYTV